MSQRKVQCVEAVSDGKGAFREGFGTFFIRWRGLGTSLAIGLLSGGMWGWLDYLNKLPTRTLNLNLIDVILVGFALVCFLGFVFFVFIRKYALRAIERKFKLHKIAHKFRDCITKAEIQALTPGQSNTEADLQAFCINSCDLISDFFKLLMRNASTECSIRIVDKMNDVLDDQTVYFGTWGRSSGLNSGREHFSKPIPANMGIPAYFSQKHKNSGVLIYHDIVEAEKLSVFEKTENETRFPDEIQSFMVAPINGWNGKNKKTILGLLYVSSPNKYAFDRKHVDYLRMFADLLGIAIPRLVLLYGSTTNLRIAK